MNEMLRESQDAAMKVNDEELEKIFNFCSDENTALALQLDKISRPYLDKIIGYRETQKKLMPLFLESKKLIEKHKKCLKTVLNEHQIYMPN